MSDASVPTIDEWTKKLGLALGEDDDPAELGMFAGADPNICDEGIGGSSALLHYAVANGDLEEVYRLIVEDNANPNARTTTHCSTTWYVWFMSNDLRTWWYFKCKGEQQRWWLHAFTSFCRW